ncbi:Shedu immune nuclease family protein [Streptomyces diacarni]|nr:Shedu immune nuclease family protein [Streptomyces diacarni]
MREQHLQRIDSQSMESTPAVNRLTESLSIWERERSNDSEEFWQTFFTERPEVLSITMGGKAYTLLSKCYVGGKSVSNSGGNVLDFLAQNSGNCALLEIKTPSTRLLQPSPYRNNTFAPSRELAGSCVQVLTYKESLMRELTNLTFSTPTLRAISPSCTLIIGDLSIEKMSQSARHSFEVFRSALKDVRILTYDELFEGIEGLQNALS